MKTRIILIVLMFFQAALIGSALMHGSSQSRVAPKSRRFEGCLPNPVPDSCQVPEQCLSCHSSMGRQ